MKKKIMIILTAIVMFSTIACGAKNEQVSLYEQGLEVVDLMEEMADNQSYIQMFTGNEQISEVKEDVIYKRRLSRMRKHEVFSRYNLRRGFPKNREAFFSCKKMKKYNAKRERDLILTLK